MIQGIAKFFRSLREYHASFWTANLSELFERVAFYGMTTILVLFLTKSRGFPNSMAIVVGGYFGLFTYGLAAFSGFLADLLGYRRAMLSAYALLAVGYFLAVTVHGTVPILGALLLVALGASLIKPSITGTVQKVCTEPQRALGLLDLLHPGQHRRLHRSQPGRAGPRPGGGGAGVLLQRRAPPSWPSCSCCSPFREPAAAAGAEARKSFGAFLGDFGRVLANWRLMALILLVAGFWSMFFQFYGPLPLYLTDDLHASTRRAGLRDLARRAGDRLPAGGGRLLRPQPRGRGGPSSSPPWSPRRASPSSAWSRRSGSWAPGILIFSVGEMIYSAHFYRYLGSIAPPDQVGMYMGFAFLPIALGYFLAGLIGGPAYDVLQEHAPPAAADVVRLRGGRRGLGLRPAADDHAAQGRGGRAARGRDRGGLSCTRSTASSSPSASR